MEISDIIQLVGVIGTFIGFIFVCTQIHISNKQTKIMNEQNEIQKSIVKREKALEMANYFMSLLDKEISVIEYIYRLCNINQLYEKIKYDEIKHFDKEEAYDILKKDVKELKKNYNDDIFNKYSELSEVYMYIQELKKDEIKKIMLFERLNWDINNFEKINASEDDEYHKMKLEIEFEMNLYKQKLSRFYTDYRNALLNKLEYFSMYFVTNLADEEVVYQSLHQVFLSIVQELYGVIAYANSTGGKDKYYTNIIKLYNIWAKRDVEKGKEILKTEREISLSQKYVE